MGANDDILALPMDSYLDMTVIPVFWKLLLFKKHSLFLWSHTVILSVSFYH